MINLRAGAKSIKGKNSILNCYTVMKRKNVAESYLVKKFEISNKTTFTEHFWLKIGTLMARGGVLEDVLGLEDVLEDRF